MPVGLGLRRWGGRVSGAGDDRQYRAKVSIRPSFPLPGSVSVKSSGVV